MTDRLADVVLSRPAPAPDAGPLDDTLYDMVEARFRRIVRPGPAPFCTADDTVVATVSVIHHPHQPTALHQGGSGKCGAQTAIRP